MNSPAEPENASAERAKSRERFVQALRIGLGLLYHDRAAAALMLAVIAFVPAAAVQSEFERNDAILALCLTAAINMVAVYVITVRCYRMLGRAGTRIFGPGLIVTPIFGLALWVVLRGPLLIVQSAAVSPLAGWLLIASLGPAAYFNLKYFFYHLPLAIGYGGSLHRSFEFASTFTRDNLLLPVRILIGPAAAISLLTALIATFSPDGRDLWVHSASAALEELFWVLVPYLTCGYFAISISEQQWRELGLDPYRGSRLTTLAVQGPEWLARTFRPKHAIGLIVIGILVWLGNAARATEIPPTADIEVKKFAVAEKRAKVELALSDPQYRFRGFTPQFFILGGDQGTFISGLPEKFTFEPSADGTHAVVTLEFTTDKSDAEIRKLKDLFLWYRRAKMNHLMPETAEKIE